MPTLRRLVVILIATPLALYVAAALSLFFAQRRFLFPAPAPQAVRAPPSAQLLELPSPDGAVFALWRPAAAGHPTLVTFHGNAEQLSEQVDDLIRYGEAGLGVLAVEFPGYGPASAQAPSETAFYRAGERALAHLTGPLGVARDDVVLLGRSIGTGVAVEMASRGWGRRMILVSAYTSIPDVAGRSFPIFPTQLLVRDRFESLRKAPAISIPVLMLHGRVDAVIPFELGERLSKAFPHATLVPLPSVGHNDVFERHPELYARVVAFAQGAPGPVVPESEHSR